MAEYKYLVVAFTTLVLAQSIKFTIESIRDNKLKWGRFFNGSGGMPSSHSSFTFSLAIMLGFNEGFTSPLFAIALVFSLVVAYDSMGLRKESSKQAEAINKIVEEFINRHYKIGIKHLKEELGHNPIEVIAGMFLGFLTSSFFTFVVF
ncbi:MAG: divergent PAP2 family protein [Mollicutes bacterium]|nr:divergent PAP2 family protein [Mollicutes bacterium]